MNSKLYLDDNGFPVVVTKERLTPKMIQQRRVSLKRRIGKLLDDNIEMEGLIMQNNVRVDELQRALKLLESEEVTNYIAREKDLEELALKKADDLLREYVGVEAHDKLKSGKSIIFTATNGLEYRITPEGVVGRKCGSRFKKICVIKPRDIPLSDSIIAIITSVKQKPRSFPTVGNQEVR